MGIFSRNYDSQVPEEGDLPRKKGVARFFELLGRDLANYFKSGVLAFLGLLPFLIGISFSVSSHAVLPMLVSGVFGGMLAAPQICGVADTILRSMRDEPGWWWGTYRKAWKRNAKASLVPGAIFGLVSAIQLFVLFHLDLLAISNMLLLIVSAIFSLGLMSYLIPMLVLLDVPVGGLFKNSAILFLGHLPRSILAALAQLVCAAVILMFFPYSIVVLLLVSFWLPFLMAFLVIYPILDETFSIEESISVLQRQELDRILNRE